MQVPSYDFRQLAPGESVRENEVEVTEAQKQRIEELLDKDRMRRAEMLAARKGNTKAAKRRRGY